MYFEIINEKDLMFVVLRYIEVDKIKILFGFYLNLKLVREILKLL